MISVKTGPAFREPVSLEKQLEAALAYEVERNRQLRGDAWSTKPTVTDEQLETVHDELAQICTESDPVLPEGAVWLPVEWPVVR